MTACGKCGEEVLPPGRFCGLCGAPTAATTGSSVVLAEKDADPLARTAPADPKELAKLRLAHEAARVEGDASAKSDGKGGTKPMRARVAPTVNDLVAIPAPGAKVQVEWSDGKRYPGTVKHASAEQCLVLFADGQEQWVDVRRVSPA